MKLETVKVQTNTERGFKIINKDDFDSTKDKEWKPKATRRKKEN